MVNFTNFGALTKNMKKLVLFFSIFLFSMALNAQTWHEAVEKTKQANIVVNFYEHYPYFYKDVKTGKFAGIEYDILQEFIVWCKNKKGVTITQKFVPNTSFKAFYKNMQRAESNNIGFGSVAITFNRAEEFNMSAPYMKNISVLVLNGNTQLSLDNAVSLKEINSMQAHIVEGAIHESILKQLFNEKGYEFKPEYANDENDALTKVSKDKGAYCMVDVVSYWNFLKRISPNSYLKIYRPFSKNEEFFGIITSKNSDWTAALNEFLESGFGFTSTKKYKEILETYLSAEVMQTIEIK